MCYGEHSQCAAAKLERVRVFGARRHSGSQLLDLQERKGAGRPINGDFSRS
jgi:hypothetical protein